jgi:hypothetical protein
VQASIGATGALAYDLTAACSGFVVGMVNGVHFLRGGEYENVLVIGADVLSRYVDWRDRGTCILFGDGAGACLLTRTENPEDCALLGFDMHSDGTGNGNLTAAFTRYALCFSQIRHSARFCRPSLTSTSIKRKCFTGTLTSTGLSYKYITNALFAEYKLRTLRPTDPFFCIMPDGGGSVRGAAHVHRVRARGSARGEHFA